MFDDYFLLFMFQLDKTMEIKHDKTSSNKLLQLDLDSTWVLGNGGTKFRKNFRVVKRSI
jgi:hypothetical protein